MRALEGRGFGAAETIGIGIGAGTGLTEFEKEEPTGYFATCMISPRRHGYETTETALQVGQRGRRSARGHAHAGVMAYRDNYKEIQTTLGLD